MSDQVSELTTNRLSLYLRYLSELEGRGVRTVSSNVLAQEFGLTAALIRKDLSNFGDFGIRGVGYVVKDLSSQLRIILGLDQSLKVAIMGAGNLGLALADYQGFGQDGFRIVALFDNVREKTGLSSKRGVPIFHISDLPVVVKNEEIAIAVIAVPASAAQQVVNQVVESGVKAVLNFSPGTLRVPSPVKVKNVDFTVSLESLSFFLANQDVHMARGKWARDVEKNRRGDAYGWSDSGTKPRKIKPR